MIPAGAIQSVRIAVGLLSNGKYETLEKVSQGKRLSSSEMSRAINEYGRHLVDPPEEAYRDFSYYETENEQGRTFSVDFPLWTQEEGRSDLEVHLTMQEVTDGIYSIEVDDILVP